MNPKTLIMALSLALVPALFAEDAKPAAPATPAVEQKTAKPARPQITPEQRAEMKARRDKMIAERRAKTEAKMLEIVKKYIPEEEKAKALVKELSEAGQSMMRMRGPRPPKMPPKRPAQEAAPVAR